MIPAITQSLPPLRPASRLVLASLYEQQPATPDLLRERTGLSPAAVAGALDELRGTGLLRGGVPLRDGRPGYVWVDVASLWPRPMEVGA